MYKNKKIIVITGRTASGKTYLTNLLHKNTDVFGINLDETIATLMPYKKRMAIFKKRGKKELEERIYPIVKKTVLAFIEIERYDTFIIEGVNADILFADILDIKINCTAPYEVRKKRALKRGNSLKQFKFYESLND